MAKQTKQVRNPVIARSGWWESEEERTETVRELGETLALAPSFDPARRQVEVVSLDPSPPATPIMDALARSENQDLGSSSAWEVVYDEFRCVVAYLASDFEAWRAWQAWPEHRSSQIAELFEKLEKCGLAHEDTRIEEEKERLSTLQERWDRAAFLNEDSSTEEEQEEEWGPEKLAEHHLSELIFAVRECRGSVPEDRIKALRDKVVAGEMLKSFDYALHGVELEQDGSEEVESEQVDQ